MHYLDIELWKNRGFINNDLCPEKQLELAKNLVMSKNLLNCFLVLHNYENDYYKEVESLLYPIVVHFTIIKNGIYINDENIIHKFLYFCENNLRVKYNINKYNDDYLLCEEFIQLNSK